MPFSRLFRSRWAALFWAAGIIWTAVDVAGSTPAPRADDGNAAAAVAVATDAMGDDVDANSLAEIANLVDG